MTVAVNKDKGTKPWQQNAMADRPVASWIGSHPSRALQWQSGDIAGPIDRQRRYFAQIHQPPWAAVPMQGL